MGLVSWEFLSAEFQCSLCRALGLSLCVYLFLWASEAPLSWYSQPHQHPHSTLLPPPHLILDILPEREAEQLQYLHHLLVFFWTGSFTARALVSRCHCCMCWCSVVSCRRRKKSLPYNNILIRSRSLHLNLKRCRNMWLKVTMLSVINQAWTDKWLHNSTHTSSMLIS